MTKATIRTVRNTKAQRASALASLARTAFLYERGESLMVDTLRTTGATPDAAKEFALGYLASKWNPTALELTDDIVRSTRALIDGASSTAKALTKTQTTRRTAKQDADCAACRKAWQRFLEKNDIAKTETRGATAAKAKAAKATRAPQMAGSTDRGNASPVTSTTGKDAEQFRPAVPSFKDVGTAADWLARVSVQLRATHDANVKVLSLVQREALLACVKVLADATKPAK